VQELPVTGHSHFTALFNSGAMHPALYLYSFAGFVFFLYGPNLLLYASF
jgi:hypothetical protein